jgi:probable DNA repair protein
LTVVRHALLGLGLNDRHCGFAEVSEFVRSPYVALAEQELAGRARLDAALRVDAELEVPLWRLVRAVERGPNRGWGTSFRVPGLEGCLRALLALTRAAPRRQRLSAWSATFAECLKTLGWPGERRLDSTTYQAVERFRELLVELATLDVMLGELSYAQALARLEDLAAECVFQPLSGPAPVQILGLLESQGLSFTHLWVSGLHDQRWPEAPRPNPFIPVAMQRKLQMPHASAEWELAAAERFMSMWLHSAENVVMSYPQNDGDEALRASPLLAVLEEVAPDALPQSKIPTYGHQLQRSAAVREDLCDYTAPAVAKGASVRGGTSLFKDQGACPFRAFAAHRLGARGLDEPAPGLDARARGTVVHRLLELLWSELKSQRRLLELDANRLDEVVDTAVVQALSEQARGASSTLTGRFFELERTRLKTLASAWLDKECERPAFEVVAPEHRQMATIGGLPVRIQPDRVDRLANGSYLLIDYKTGKPRVDDWFDERIEEPQLPIYCSAFENNDNQLDLFEPKTVGGVAFGVLRSDQVGYKGLADQSDVAPGIVALEKAKPTRELRDWPQLKRVWRERLEALAREFLRGDARVAPKSGAKTCAYCDIKPLCRINEILRHAGDASGSGGMDM